MPINDISAAVGEYLTVDQVRHAKTFDEWLTPRVFPSARRLCVLHRYAIVGNWAPVPSPAELLARAKAIVGYSFDFGLPKACQDEASFVPDLSYDADVHEPGSANIQIAEVIKHLIETVCPGAWIGVQWEIGSALADLGMSVPQHCVAVPRTGEYLSTTGVASYLAQAGLHEFQCVIVVAHGDHVRRCVGSTRRAIMDVRSAKANWADPPTLVVPDLNSIKYPTKGHQVWVSGAGKSEGGPDAYRPHDVAGRVRALDGGWLDWDDLLTPRFE